MRKLHQERMWRVMIQCFNTNDQPLLLFRGTKIPRLLSASYITKEFSQHARLLHNHQDRLEIMFVHSGSGQYIIENNSYPVIAGDIIVCNNGVMHDEAPQYNESLSMLNLAFTNLSLPGLPENHLISNSLKPVLKADKHIVLIDAIFQTIFDFMAFEKGIKGGINHYLALALLSLINQAFGKMGEPEEEKTGDNRLLYDIRQYIDEHYTENLTLEKLSQHFCLSPSRLSHLFKQRLGYSTINYIMRRRIGEAQSQLIMSKQSVTEIAFAVGFENISNFNVLFKKYVGLAPNIYRKKYTLEDAS